MGKSLNTTKRTFNVSAAVIRQLGEELITDEVTAIMELVKNSYDADATWVRIEINTVDSYSDFNSNSFYKKAKGFIVVEDNGHGMDEDDILNKWLMISISEKRGLKRIGGKSPGGRTPLGDKGVGRLSTQKLASKVEMFTTKEELSNIIHLSFNWDDFNETTAITDVKTEFELISKGRKSKGTLLVLADLNHSEVWNDEPWNEFRGQLSKLISPFEENKGFKVYLQKNKVNYDLDELNKSIRKQAVSYYKFILKNNILTVKGTIKFQKLMGGSSPSDKEFYDEFILKDNGLDFFDFLKDTIKNKHSFLENINYLNEHQDFLSFNIITDLNDLQLIRNATNNELLADEIFHPGNFSGEIDDYYFSPNDSLLNAFDSLSIFKTLVKSQAGVRIYRDGFGIKPYGFDGNDWLGLSKGITSGASFYGLRPSNTVGFISISALENSQLKEKTDREGFMDTFYAKNFFKIIDTGVSQINDVLTSIRRGFNSYKKYKNEKLGRFENNSDAFIKVNEIKPKIRNIEAKASESKLQLNKISNYLSLERENISVDKRKTPDQIIEIFKKLESLLVIGNELLSGIESMIESAKKVENFANYVKPQLETLEQQIHDMSELAGMGLTAEALSHELSNIVSRLNNEVQKFEKAVSSNKISQSVINIFLTQIKSSLISFKKQLSHIDPALKYVREKRELFTISELINDTIEHFSSQLAEDHITIEKIVSSQDFSIEFSRGKLIQVIDNLILNSQYWLKAHSKINKQFKGRIFLEISRPFLLIYDNGSGINLNIENRIFQPFITGKPKEQGRGLGLFIIQQLLETESCSINLLDERNSFGKKFKFQINLNPAISKK